MSKRRALVYSSWCLAAAVIALPLSSCGGSEPPANNGGALGPTTSTQTEAATTTQTVETRTTTEKESSVTTLSLESFVTPTKNIACLMDDESVRCDISKKDWTIPRPADCELDYGNGATISRTSSRGEISCAGDTILGISEAVLPYGTDSKVGTLICRSRESGITCQNARGHGFSLSRQSYRLF